MANNRLSLPEKLFTKTVKVSDCLIWVGQKNKRGYGCLRLNGRLQRSHRIMYELHNGPIPEGMVIMHSCDNPSCVNPDHLSAGTQLENVRDMHSKGRAIVNRGADHQCSKITPAQAVEIRSRYKSHDRKNGGAALANEFGVHQKTILAIVHGKHWTELPDIKRELLTLNGISQTIAAWSRTVGIPANTLHARLRLGWSAERVLTQGLNDYSHRTEMAKLRRQETSASHNSNMEKIHE